MHVFSWSFADLCVFVIQRRHRRMRDRCRQVSAQLFKYRWLFRMFLLSWIHFATGRPILCRFDCILESLVRNSCQPLPTLYLYRTLFYFQIGSFESTAKNTAGTADVDEHAFLVIERKPVYSIIIVIECKAISTSVRTQSPRVGVTVPTSTVTVFERSCSP
jgi:hypothetical protein